MTAPFTEAEINETRFWLARFASEWREEVPMRIHESGHGTSYGLGSSPPFAPEFISYIGKLHCGQEGCTECAELDRRIKQTNFRHSNERTRTSKAFRKLRAVAPLEFDVLYLATQQRLTVVQITDRLNARAEARDLPDRYTSEDVAILALSGYDKLKRWY